MLFGITFLTINILHFQGSKVKGLRGNKRKIEYKKNRRLKGRFFLFFKYFLLRRIVAKYFRALGLQILFDISKTPEINGC